MLIYPADLVLQVNITGSLSLENVVCEVRVITVLSFIDWRKYTFEQRGFVGMLGENDSLFTRAWWNEGMGHVVA
jgi:hypothetical protein